jgi:hypothetical protein
MLVKIAILLVLLPCSLLYEPHLRLKNPKNHSPKNELKSWLRRNGTVIVSDGQSPIRHNDRKFTVNLIGCIKYAKNHNEQTVNVTQY